LLILNCARVERRGLRLIQTADRLQREAGFDKQILCLHAPLFLRKKYKKNGGTSPRILADADALRR
jgi:hypothetical protein